MEIGSFEENTPQLQLLLFVGPTTYCCLLFFFCFFVDVFFGYGVHTLPKNLEVSIENAAAGRTFAELTSLPQWSTYEVNVKRFVVLK